MSAYTCGCVCVCVCVGASSKADSLCLDGSMLVRYELCNRLTADLHGGCEAERPERSRIKVGSQRVLCSLF